MRRAAALLALVLMSGCAAANAPAGDEVSETITNNFVRLVAAPSRPGGGGATIQKWATPIRYASVGPGPILARASLDLAMNQLAGLTGVSIEKATEDLPNYLVIFTPVALDQTLTRYAGVAAPFFESAADLERLRQQPQYGACALHATTQRSDSTIRSALLVVPAAGSPVETGRCITALTARSMGFFSNIERIDSAMSGAGRVDHLTSEDKLMLRVLYDARLKPGTPVEQAAPVVRSVLATLRSE